MLAPRGPTAPFALTQAPDDDGTTPTLYFGDVGMTPDDSIDSMIVRALDGSSGQDRITGPSEYLHVFRSWLTNNPNAIIKSESKWRTSFYHMISACLRNYGLDISAATLNKMHGGVGWAEAANEFAKELVTRENQYIPNERARMFNNLIDLNLDASHGPHAIRLLLYRCGVDFDCNLRFGMLGRGSPVDAYQVALYPAIMDQAPWTENADIVWIITTERGSLALADTITIRKDKRRPGTSQSGFLTAPPNVHKAPKLAPALTTTASKWTRLKHQFGPAKALIERSANDLQTPLLVRAALVADQCWVSRLVGFCGSMR